MGEPGKVGELTQGKALLLAGAWALVGVVTVVLRMLDDDSLGIVLLMGSPFFVVAVLMLVVWRIAKRRTERNRRQVSSGG